MKSYRPGEIVLLLFSFADDPRGNGILLVYECHEVGGELSESVEGTNPTYFPRRSIPDRQAGGGHDQAILAWRLAGTTD